MSLRCPVCNKGFERKPGAHGPDPRVCYDPDCRAEDSRRRVRQARAESRGGKVVEFVLPAASAAPAALPSSMDLAVPPTPAQVAELHGVAGQPLVQGSPLPACPDCRRIRLGRAGSQVAGMVVCLKDEMTLRDTRLGGAKDSQGRPPIVEDRRGDASVYWLRPDVAHLGSARGCRYFIRRS